MLELESKKLFLISLLKVCIERGIFMERTTSFSHMLFFFIRKHSGVVEILVSDPLHYLIDFKFQSSACVSWREGGAILPPHKHRENCGNGLEGEHVLGPFAYN